MEVAAHMPCVHGRKRSKCEDCAKEKERWREARAAGIRASVARANELAPQASAIAAAQMAMAQQMSLVQFRMRMQMQDPHTPQYQKNQLQMQMQHLQMQHLQMQQFRPHDTPAQVQIGQNMEAAARAMSAGLLPSEGLDSTGGRRWDGSGPPQAPKLANASPLPPPHGLDGEAISLSQWRGKVIEELAADSADAMQRLQECCGLRWEGPTREPRVGKLNFGRVAPAPNACSSARKRALRIVLRNQRPEPVFLTHLVRLPESDRFELLYATGEGLSSEGSNPLYATKGKPAGWERGSPSAVVVPAKAFRVLKQKLLPLTLAGSSSVELRVDFEPSQLPGTYDQWLLLRFELGRQGSVFNFVAQNAVLGLVACAECLSSEDAAVLWNVEAKPFLPQWLRGIFAHDLVQLPAPHISSSMGTQPARPPAYPGRVCGVCKQGLWDAFCVADKESRAAIAWDGVFIFCVFFVFFCTSIILSLPPRATSHAPAHAPSHAHACAYHSR